MYECIDVSGLIDVPKQEASIKSDVNRRPQVMRFDFDSYDVICCCGCMFCILYTPAVVIDYGPCWC